MEVYIKKGFIVERNIDLDTFRLLGVQKIKHDRKWLKTVSSIKGFVLRIVHEIYANLSDQVDNKGHSCIGKVYVKGHAYDFSPRIIN